MTDKFTLKPKSRFVKVKCNDCSKEQIVFGKASTIVKCLNCGSVLVEPRGSKAKINAKIVKVLD